MPTDHIVALLIAERDKLNSAIVALQGTKTPASPEAEAPAAEATTPKKKRVVSAASRRKNGARSEETVSGVEGGGSNPCGSRCGDARIDTCEAPAVKKSLRQLGVWPIENDVGENEGG
jgi:hypothetical protein